MPKLALHITNKDFKRPEMNIKITGSGSYIPTRIIPNIDFASHQFLDEKGEPLPYSNEVVTEKFQQITGIEERRGYTAQPCQPREAQPAHKEPKMCGLRHTIRVPGMG